jgi:hypothetical protein
LKVAATQELADHVELTQYGELGIPFRNYLRVDIGEPEMSLIMGRQTAMAAALLVTKTVPPCAAARWTTAGQLRAQGFVVLHSPTKGNPLHVSVFPPGGPQEPIEWEDTLANRFHQCFTVDKGGDTNE